MAWQTPKTDWITNPRSPMAVDFNRIEENIKFIKDNIDAKKGLIVDAINSKGDIVTIENSYQELANAITNINKNPRMASGSGQLVKVSDASAKLVVTGLPFRPARIFITGKVRTTAGFWYDSLNYSYLRYNSPYEYAIINDAVVPETIEDKLFQSGPVIRYSFSLKCTITRNNNGFEALISNPLAPPTGYKTIIDEYQTNYWYAYEQEG